MTLPYDIPELTQIASGGPLVRIPSETDVPFTDRVRKIVDTPQFQRLRHIRQLGLTDHVYPGAMHTRFEHALGVYHNALRYLWQLGQCARFRSIVSERDAELLIVTALLHDLGHWPLAHPIEDLDLPDVPEHEEYAGLFLSPGTELGAVLQDVWDIDPRTVLGLLTERASDPARQLLQSILSGPIDIDKMDYLERDSLHSGVPYGRHFDKNRLIRSLTVNEAGNGLAITGKGRTAAELMVFARYVMFSEVYWHHAVRSATAMFCRSFYVLAGQIDRQEFFRSTQAEAVTLLRTLAEGTPVGELVESVFGVSRRLYKRVAEYAHSDTPEVYGRLAGQSYRVQVRVAQQLSDRLAEELGTPVGPHEVLIDGPSRKREIQFHVDIHDEKRDRYRPLSEVSPVVETLARRQFDDFVKRVRIFAHPRLTHAIRDCDCFDDLVREVVHAECEDEVRV